MINPVLEKNGPLTDSPQPYMALPLQLLIATANLAQDSWVNSSRRTATAPRASLITDNALAKLLPYWPAVAAPPVRPPVRPTYSERLIRGWVVPRASFTTALDASVVYPLSGSSESKMPRLTESRMTSRPPSADACSSASFAL